MAEMYRIPQEVIDGQITGVEAAGLTAIYNSMVLIQDRQRLRGFEHTNSDIKLDGSLVMDTDLDSEALAQRIYADLAPGVAFSSEEGAHTAGDPTLKRAGYDPNDGSRAHAVGAPSSVINTIYNINGSVYGALIGDPSTGRVFSAFGDENTHGRLMDLTSGTTLRHARNVTTWSGQLNEKGQVFIDNNRPHRHSGHATLLGDQHDDLRRILRQMNVGTLEMGSNGAHQLYVASGGDRAAAAITTARGNPEDTAAGAFLVERSQGAVQRFTAVDGIISPVDFESADYDLLIAANNQQTLQTLGNLLLGLSRL